MNIRDRLFIGADRAQTIGALAEILCISRREVEIAVQQARLDGVPIVSGSEGLWLAGSAQEVTRAAESLRKRLVSQYATVRAMRATGRRMQQAESKVEPLTLPWSSAA